ncbi:LOW QUALITY PROTEIN: sodium- and chloride-dependent glycine transporter 1 [Manduca sexta]|uniref:LOW QUALITY PROTEIN: sodium- and chloride-dependent glycine transporter 1 n=1 Tax=Manduca sexta TaxID=7130 RepID=UPI00188F3546|nr:LOW QUALITY PROTEIN: sodium- and chloride-dependent glycine transporter 1 [Manduca sexta]
MFDSYRLKEWLSLPLIRAHLCTLAVAFSFNSTWRVPRDAFRYGGVTYALVLSVVMVTVALPVVLLHLAIGQLSQQDAVGVWRAVPFFRGVGYLRMLVSFLGSVYTSIYVALTVTYFLYTLSNSIPFLDCMELITEEEDIRRNLNASECLDATFMSPITENPEYYLAVALIIVVLWIAFPFIFYSPVKLIKRIYYVCGPILLLLCIVLASVLGDSANISSILASNDWSNFLHPDIWHGAVVQALLSTQIAGGFLISTGDSVYASTNVQWSALVFVTTNILASWTSLLFWFGVSPAGDVGRDTGMMAVLVETYRTADRNGLDIVWPMLIFAMLFLSGIITMLTLLLPIYDRLRRVGGVKWRVVSFGASIAGAGVSLAALAGRIPALTLIEDTAVPFLTSVATIVEIFSVQFHLCPGVGLVRRAGNHCSIFVWWSATIFIGDPAWTEPPWTASSLAATTATAVVIFLVFATVSICRQVQYDFIGKLTSSFKPSRHWGPRDPITHYYWLASREEADRNMPRNRYYRRQLGQLSTRPSILHVPNVTNTKQITDFKRRSNSDDWLYTVYRKKYLTHVLHEHVSERRRSKSLDWAVSNVFKRNSDIISISKDTIDPKETNNNVIDRYVSDNVLK